MISSKNIYHSKKEMLWFILFLAMTFFYLVLAILANADLTVGRFALFMDERITFDGVNNILHPDGFIHFLWSILDGGDHRYGRSLWNSIALFSFLPDFFFGESGQIFAGRMTQVILLLSGFTLLIVTFVHHWALRFLLLSSLLAMPYTSYFMTMPKPEPLQILFVATFLFYYKKKNMKLGDRYWIFLGLAFGAKISTLPLMVVFLFVACLKFCQKEQIKESITLVSKTLIYFLIGLGISVPILVPAIAASIWAFKLASKITVKRHVYRIILILVYFLIFNTIAKVVTRLIITSSGFGTWLSQTFKNTTHGSDLSTIGFGDWVNFFCNDWFLAPSQITIAFLLSSFILLMIYIMDNFKEISVNKKLIQSIPLPLLVIVGGLILNFSIFIAVQRLWGLYLFPGVVLILVGLFAIVENYIVTNGSCLSGYKIKSRTLSFYLSLMVLMLISLITFNWWLPKSISSYENLSIRSKSEDYNKHYSTYMKITEFLTNLSKLKNKRLTVAFDQSLYPPKSNEKYLIIPIWGPYSNWEPSPDVIIFSDSHTPKNIKPLDMNSVEYKLRLNEIDGYKKYVINQGNACLAVKCYRRSSRLPVGGEILTLVTQFPDSR